MKLSAYLEIKNLTHAAFAQMIGCEQPTVTRYVKGRVPSPDVMERIASATGGHVTPNDFFDLPSATARKVSAA